MSSPACTSLLEKTGGDQNIFEKQSKGWFRICGKRRDTIAALAKLKVEYDYTNLCSRFFLFIFYLDYRNVFDTYICKENHKTTVEILY